MSKKEQTFREYGKCPDCNSNLQVIAACISVCMGCKSLVLEVYEDSKGNPGYMVLPSEYYEPLPIVFK